MVQSQTSQPEIANPVLAPKPAAPSPEGAVLESGLPAAPHNPEEVGLSPSFLLELALKVIHYADAPSAEHVSRVMGLPAKLVEALLESLKSDRLCEIVGGGSTYDLTTNYRFRLTERGEVRAEQALERCRYAGAAPVTISQYNRVVGKKGKEVWRPSDQSVETAFQRLIVDPTAAGLLSKALRSGRCAMVFGPSGNGKTHLLAEFINNLEGEIVVPYALYAYGQIIRIFDQTVHVRKDPPEPAAKKTTISDDPQSKAAPKEDAHDRRWVRIQRPGLIVGGELTAESLELGYDPITKFYQAPKHLKAQGGVLLVDDFGRQRISPVDLLNRWIMSLERGTDNLLLRTGESIEVPFDVRLLFSTNLDPADLADAAFLRRIPYKVHMPATAAVQFTSVLDGVCRASGVPVTTASLDAAVSFIVENCDLPLSGALARDLVTIIIDNAALDGREPALTVDAVALAYLQFTGSLPRNYKPPKEEKRTPAPVASEPARVEVPPEFAAPAPEASPPEAPAPQAPAEEAPPETAPAAPPPAPAPSAEVPPQKQPEGPRDPTLAELAARLTGSAESDGESG
jgi:hypothetical protein